MLTLYNKEWLSGESVNPDKLNPYGSDVLARLYNKNLAIARVTTDNNLYLNAGNNIFTKFNRSVRVGLDIQQGSAVKVNFGGGMKQTRLTGTTAANFVWLDVLIDESIYLSSLAASPTSDGVTKSLRLVANFTVQARFNLFLTQLEEGFHTFELVGKTADNGDATYTMNLTPHSFFWVEEYGVNIGQLIGANNT